VTIGNPPYLGRRKMAAELGADYVSQLDDKYPNPGVSDFVTYWFPLAHNALPKGGRAGFVATQVVRDGDSRRASLDYVVKNDGVIFEAVSVTPVVRRRRRPRIHHQLGEGFGARTGEEGPMA
jgi:hypothetical protein